LLGNSTNSVGFTKEKRSVASDVGGAGASGCGAPSRSKLFLRDKNHLVSIL